MPLIWNDSNNLHQRCTCIPKNIMQNWMSELSHNIFWRTLAPNFMPLIWNDSNNLHQRCTCTVKYIMQNWMSELSHIFLITLVPNFMSLIWNDSNNLHQRCTCILKYIMQNWMSELSHNIFWITLVPTFMPWFEMIQTIYTSDAHVYWSSSCKIKCLNFLTSLVEQT